MVRGKTGECCLGVLPLKNCCSASFSPRTSIGSGPGLLNFC